jgi:hypothetical protein
MLEVAGAICGLHAQLMSSAELTLWARVEDLEPDAVQRALWEHRSLVKAWAMRGTLHLLPAADFPLWQAALSTYRHFLKPAWSRAFGVTPDQLEELVTAVGQALDGRMLTRDELADEVATLTDSPDLAAGLRESWGALLKPASFRGQLCYAPSAGQNVRFTRPDRWLPEWSPVDPDEALKEVARRFLSAHGPATRNDLARWWAVSPAQAGRLIASLGDEVSAVDVEGTSARMLTQHLAEAVEGNPSQSVRLLPAFDHYVIAATLHASNLLPGSVCDRVYRAQGWISPVLLVDGRMDGVWRYERQGEWVVVEIEPFVDLGPEARSRAEGEAERLAAFLGGELDLSWA